MASILSNQFKIHVGFAEWMKFGLPIAVVLIGIIYTYFYFRLGNERKEHPEDFVLEKKPWIVPQVKVVIVFSAVVLLWIFREPLSKWTGFAYGDESAALLGSILLFVIPGDGETKLLTWKDTEKLPWGILLLFGGGLALATTLEVNGVIKYITTFFSVFATWQHFVLLTIVVFIAIFGTEFMSNLALVTLFVPIIGAFALETGQGVIQLAMPVTMAASCAFMLPVGTPPNAIVFSSGKITIAQMARIGFVFNVFSLVLITLVAYFFM